MGEKLNYFITEMQKTINCDADCQSKKKEEELLRNIMVAKSRLASAPYDLKSAQEKYAVFSGGEQALTEQQLAELQQQAQQRVLELKAQQDAIIAELEAQLETFSANRMNFQNVLELYINYSKENLKLKKELMNTENDTLVNQRKTYYHDQEVDGLKMYYYYIIFVIYAISVICFAVFSFIYGSEIDWKKRFAILIALVFLPFLSTTILKYFIYIVYRIYDILPKNVYKENY
jgi:hypothetical protein